MQAQQKVEEVNYLLPAPSFLPAFIGGSSSGARNSMRVEFSFFGLKLGI